MRKKILVVDDDKSVRRMVARVLEMVGHYPQVSGSGQEAFEFVRDTELDLVLLDLRLPPSEGWAIFSQLNRCKPWLPIVVITALPNQHDLAARMGVDALMEKPLDLPLLLETIEQLLVEPEQARSRRLLHHDLAGAHLT